MLDSLNIDHGRKEITRIGRCADCRREGVATPTTLMYGGSFVCELHKMDREAEYQARKEERK